MTESLYTVFGASGFLGRYVVQLLAGQGHRIRVAVRHADEALFLKPLGAVGQISIMAADLKIPSSIARAVEGADHVINLVGILAPSGKQNFENIQNLGAGLVARAAKDAGVKHLVHISAIGADIESPSHYARSKAEGETAVSSAFPTATILRPSLVFGKEDQFFNRFAALARISPVIPVICGETRFQPVYVQDVAQAVVKCAQESGHEGLTYELGGPTSYSFRELLHYILEVTLRKRCLINVPTPVAKLKAIFFALLPNPPITLDQIRLLQQDNVVHEGAKGLKDLGIEPTPIEAVIPRQLVRYRKFGRFTRK